VQARGRRTLPQMFCSTNPLQLQWRLCHHHHRRRHCHHYYRYY
jgi:hypothetical protein